MEKINFRNEKLEKKTPNLNRKLHASKQIKVENRLDYCFSQFEKLKEL
jgi:hypothetical protein